MAFNPHVSVIVVLQNCAEVLEEPLSQLLDISEVPVELIIIDDASTDHTSDVITSLLDNHESDHHYFFPFEDARGRANALNFALEQISAPYIWMVDDLTDLQTGFLKDALDKLRDSRASFLYSGQPPLPEHLHGLINEYENLLVSVEDRHFLWKWFDIPAAERFLNPFWSDRHGLELALRVRNRVEYLHTDPVFSPRETSPAPEMRRNLLYSLLYQPELTTTLREEIFRKIRAEDEVVLDQKRKAWIDEQYQRAVHQVEENRTEEALVTLDAILEIEPENRQVEELKNKVLKRLRRHEEVSEPEEDSEGARDSGGSVEAGPEQAGVGTRQKDIFEEQADETSEPVTEDHHPEKQNEPEAAPTSKKPPEAVVTLIIPTTGDGKPRLEACLNSVQQFCDPDSTRLIVVDNASVDDTSEFLEQLQNESRPGCRVIANSYNQGFGASVNQALEEVETPFVCIMHYDVVLHEDTPAKLIRLLEDSEVDVLAPTAEQAAIEAQQPGKSDAEKEVVESSYVESFMMTFRREVPYRFDEIFGPAYFEDFDFCNQVRSNGGRCGVAVNLTVEHNGGVYLNRMGLTPLDKPYWKNLSTFNRKWNLEPQITDEFAEYDDLTQLALIGEEINVFYPEPHLAEHIRGLLTSEMRTELMESKFTAEALDALIRAMIAVNERELMRRFEEQLADFEINQELCYLLVQFYFDNNIFSRCLKYIDALGPQETFRFSFYRLKIAVAERDFSHAVALLEELMQANPIHPGMLKFAGDIHRETGNQEESEKFYTLAARLDPFRFPKQETME